MGYLFISLFRGDSGCPSPLVRSWYRHLYMFMGPLGGPFSLVLDLSETGRYAARQNLFQPPLAFSRADGSPRRGGVGEMDLRALGLGRANPRDLVSGAQRMKKMLQRSMMINGFSRSWKSSRLAD